MVFVIVKDNNIERAIRDLKRRLNREGWNAAMRRCREYTPPSRQKLEDRKKKEQLLRKRRRMEAERYGK